MDLIELLQPILEYESEQIAQVAKENIMHSAGDSDRFAWLRRSDVANTTKSIAYGSSAVVWVSGKNSIAEEHGAPGQPPAPFLRPALVARQGPFTRAVGGAISHIVADQLARKR